MLAYLFYLTASEPTGKGPALKTSQECWTRQVVDPLLMCQHFVVTGQKKLP